MKLPSYIRNEVVAICNHLLKGYSPWILKDAVLETEPELIVSCAVSAGAAMGYHGGKYVRYDAENHNVIITLKGDYKEKYNTDLPYEDEQGYTRFWVSAWVDKDWDDPDDLGALRKLAIFEDTETYNPGTALLYIVECTDGLLCKVRKLVFDEDTNQVILAEPVDHSISRK